MAAQRQVLAAGRMGKTPLPTRTIARNAPRTFRAKPCPLHTMLGSFIISVIIVNKTLTDFEHTHSLPNSAEPALVVPMDPIRANPTETKSAHWYEELS